MTDADREELGRASYAVTISAVWEPWEKRPFAEQEQHRRQAEAVARKVLGRFVEEWFKAAAEGKRWSPRESDARRSAAYELRHFLDAPAEGRADV